MCCDQVGCRAKGAEGSDACPIGRRLCVFLVSEKAAATEKAQRKRTGILMSSIEISLNANNGTGDEVADVREERGSIVISVAGSCGWASVRFVSSVDAMGSS